MSPGKTASFSRHNMPDAESLCDRVAVLNKGHLRGCGQLRAILGVETSATEILVEDPKPEFLIRVKKYASSVVQTGERLHLQIQAEHDVAKVLQFALEGGAKIVS